jgi:cellulose synthase/poly-beta-1,6-N-acetylglucosamine synthase-like glycosyltransferase
VSVLDAVALISLVYFGALNAIYLVFTLIAWRQVASYARARSHEALAEAFASPLTPPISVLLPAFNEEAVIVESVRSLLGLRYPELEIVVVNDGSTDATVERLRQAFDLVPVRKALRDALPTAPVHGVEVARRTPQLVVVDKANGGKADALNAGINAARYPYFCAVDADAVLEEDALLRVAQPILDDPDLVVASGGIVRIANGCTVDHGRVVDVRLPRSALATLQVIEYFRGFLIGRVAWSRLNALLIISGAFGVFHRATVEAAGGYWTSTVGEDVELVLRLHRYLRERDEPYRIVFVPDPVCWSEVPEDLRTLSRQRRRWQRGLGESLWRHRRLVGRPRFGVIGLVALPYVLVFEFFGALIEVLGVPLTLVWWAMGELSLAFGIAFLLLAFLFGMLLSLGALALEEFTFRRQPRARDVGRLLAFLFVESVGYRQLNELWRTLGLVDLTRRKRGWGAQRRRGFARA